MFSKVMIANRGEIAVRILRACRELGLQTVAVYSDVDRGALHVRYADDAYYIGRGPAQESYLRVDRMMEIARRSGAEAIHPGYGFLAENPSFAAACEDAGIAFIGPSAKAMAEMGDKVAARRLMQEAGVPVLPGTEIDPRDEQVHHHARQIGYPLFIKATAGGGGKGMRLVRSEDELDQSLEAARREAQGAFGDDRLYLEKAIPDARHVEVQILADAYGNVIYLGERECSIQRRHQKLIEEAPSPALDEHLRQQMGRIAVRAAAAVNYVNAGTVEFLLTKGPSGRESFYFLEMNTRLQVEHPVTEMVVHIDIVKEQLQIASGEALRYTQEDVHVKGWAIECRITAEDPFNGFLPVTGRIISLAQPSGPGIRVDSGNYSGLDVSPYYDPLLGKLVVWGNTREEAIQRMRRALREYRIIGIPTSIPFHKRVMETPAFVRGTYDTSFIDADFWQGEPDPGRVPPRRMPPGEFEEIAALAAVLLHHERAGRRADQLLATPGPRGGYRLGGNNRANMWKLTARQEAIGR